MRLMLKANTKIKRNTYAILVEKLKYIVILDTKMNWTHNKNASLLFQLLDYVHELEAKIE
jgi:hypothetical protein